MILLGGGPDRPLTEAEARWADRVLSLVLVLAAYAIVGVLGGR